MVRKSKIRVGRFHPIVCDVSDALGIGTREAKKLVVAMFDAMTAALLRGESVELPMGTLEVVNHEQRQNRQWMVALQPWQVAQPREVYRKRSNVVLKPINSLESE